MKHVLLIATVMAGISAAAFARELGRLVQPREGQNVVAGTGEKLDFRLTAERGEDGTVMVEMLVPPGSEVQKAAYLRLEVVRDKQVLLWSRLASRKEPDGTLKAGFQIHDSLAKDAAVVIAYEAQPQGRPAHLTAYHVRIPPYITDRNAAKERN